MAHHKATLKNIRKISARTERNGARKTRIRTFIKKVDTAIADNNQEGANIALKNAQKEVMRGVSKGIMKLETASRKLSRLNKSIKTLSAK